MSLRPRFAGDGQLVLPVDVALVTGDELSVTGRIGRDAYDPFQRVASDLLLVEEFARLDLTPRASLAAWFERHGGVDVQRSDAVDHDLLPPWDPRREPLPPIRGLGELHDPLRLIAAEQRSVAWHLASLARLSDHLQPSTGTPGAWDPAWANPVLDIHQHHATVAGPDGPAADPPWWADEPEAELARRRDRRERVRHRLLDGLGDGPGSLMELQRRLIAPYIFGVADHRLRVAWAHEAADPTDPARRGPIVIHEQRSWTTLLTPVYVQLLEGLRRVSEGLRGAGFCRECGLPFLTLDARRALFCNDRERYRHGQRQRRVRLGQPAGRREPTR